MLIDLETSLENSGWSAVNEVECRNKVPEVDRCQITQCSTGKVILLDCIQKNS